MIADILRLPIKKRIQFFVLSFLWTALIITFIYYGLRWDKERYEKAKARNPLGIVEDKSPEQYYS